MKKKHILSLFAFAAIITGFIYFGSNVSAQKSDVPNKSPQAAPFNNTPQTLPFSQNWTTNLITANDDWAPVLGVVGFLGNYDPGSPANVDPRTLLTPFVTNDVDVIANQTNPDTLTNGGVAEFDGITNPVVAMNGSGTADAPHIVIYLNTTGRTNIQFSCSIRDIDGSADDSVQQVDVQYRVGGVGNYTSVTGGYIADATTGGSATQVTPLNLTLPAAANNQTLVEIRVMTTNATGNDEWVGVDDISVTGSAALQQNYIDFNGDGRTDFSVVRNTGGGPSGQVTWFTQYNGLAGSQIDAWGIATDFFVPGNYDADNRTDVAIWRPGAPGTAAFFILNSATSTLRTEIFGQTGDDPTIVGDYNNDGRDDPAVYRAGAMAGNPSFWYWRQSIGGSEVFVRPWGQNGDFVAPGDYDGDGSADFVIQRNAGGGQARFWRLFATGTIDAVVFGTPTDLVVPGDYDGDGKTDIAVARGSGGVIQWWILSSLNGSTSLTNFGDSATDSTTQGDYDGDGKTDIATWRPNADPQMNFFRYQGSTSGYGAFEWGQNGDYPIANYNSH